MRNILIADNDYDFLDTRAEYLRNAGYQVFRAYSYEEAKNILNTTQVHLAIIDIRLVDDNDERDTSGLTLAKDPSYISVPKIIVTNFPTYQVVREALGATLENLPPAIDFLSKGEGADAMIIVVKDAFARYVHVNWDLVIQLDEENTRSFLYLLAFIENDVSNEHLPNRVEELEDLFRKLFYDFDQITVSRVLWSKEQQVALEIFAYTKEKDEQFVVTCGRIQEIRSAQERYEKHSPNEFKVNKTSKSFYAETMRYGATAWTLIGVELEDLIPFSSFFYQKTDRQIRITLENLFQSTLKSWYALGAYLEEDKNLSDAYCKHIDLVMDSKVLGQKILSLSKEALSYKVKINLDKSEINVRFPNGEANSFPNPIPYLTNNIPLPESQVLSGISLGNLDPETFLVDRNYNTWVVDFSQCELAPIWLDFAVLETRIRFDLMDNADLFKLFEFETQLMSMHSLDENLQPDGTVTEFRKELNAIQSIRNMVASVIGNNLTPYYVGLLFCTAKGFDAYEHEVRETKRNILSTVHRLLYSAMLCQYFSQISEHIPKNAASCPPLALQIDKENEEVSIGGRVIDITPTEYELLLYLYSRADQLCQRADIINDVFGYQELDPAAGKSLLNTHINRLRQKIESDSSNPKYILTVRGRGYKLKIIPE